MDQEVFESIFYEWLDDSNVPLSNIYIVADDYSGRITFTYHGVRASYVKGWHGGQSYVDIDNIDLDETGPDLEYLIDVLENIKYIVKDNLDKEYRQYKDFMNTYGQNMV